MKRLVRWTLKASAAVATVLVALALVSLFRPSPPWPDVRPPPGATARWRWFDRYILLDRIHPPRKVYDGVQHAYIPQPGVTGEEFKSAWGVLQIKWNFHDGVEWRAERFGVYTPGRSLPDQGLAGCGGRSLPRRRAVARKPPGSSGSESARRPMRLLRVRPPCKPRQMSRMRDRADEEGGDDMKRLRRWAFNGLAAVSALTCVATCVLWVRSRSIIEGVWRATPAAGSVRGTPVIGTTAMFFAASQGSFWLERDWVPVAITPQWRLVNEPEHYESAVPTPMTFFDLLPAVDSPPIEVIARVPAWTLALGFGALPAWWLALHWRRRRRAWHRERVGTLPQVRVRPSGDPRPLPRMRGRAHAERHAESPCRVELLPAVTLSGS